MQEGMLALMQSPRTTVGRPQGARGKLPYIVVLTNPTTGGVTASFAMLGDIGLAEPGAMIGFAGARVIEQTIRERLPEGFQRCRISQRPRHGRMVVPRQEMRATLARLCKLLTRAPADLDPRQNPRRSRSQPRRQIASTADAAPAAPHA